MLVKRAGAAADTAIVMIVIVHMLWLFFLFCFVRIFSDHSYALRTGTRLRSRTNVHTAHIRTDIRHRQHRRSHVRISQFCDGFFCSIQSALVFSLSVCVFFYSNSVCHLLNQKHTEKNVNFSPPEAGVVVYHMFFCILFWYAHNH